MKKLVIVFILCISAGHIFSQVKNPVKWSFASKKMDQNTWEIRLTATIDASWHMYSQTTPDGGPSATVISFTKNPLIALDGPAKEEGKLEQKHEELFGVDVKQFSNKVVFVQTIKLKAKAKTAISGTIEYMTCNNRECLPPTSQTFSIAIQ
ncbi:MAG: protein-disulfide reductase DsbD domain-containing protein [Flavisolibacter sp.]